MFKFRILKKVNFRSDRDNRILFDALTMWSLVMNTDEFIQKILMHPNLNSPNETNEDILNRLFAGRELRSPVVDYEADLKLVLMHVDSDNEWGYAQNGVIYIYRNKLRQKPLSQIAGFYAHEYCHLIGYFHPQPEQINPDSDVCYQVGYIVADIAARAMPVVFDEHHNPQA